MSTTSTDFDWYYYIRKKGTRYYIGLVNENGDDPSGAYDIEIFYDEIPDDLDDQDATMPIPVQFELGFLKGVAAELMSMSNKDAIDIRLRNEYMAEYEKTVAKSLHYQIDESAQPLIIKPLDLRDDDAWGR